VLSLILPKVPMVGDYRVAWSISVFAHCNAGGISMTFHVEHSDLFATAIL
jgi:hypothetical protein